MRNLFKTLIYSGLLLTAFVFSGCRKLDCFFDRDKNEQEKNYFMNTNEEFRKKYKDLKKENLAELLQVRAASEKYRDFKKAVEDGYEDISVVTPNMGHHYMKKDIVDSTFDLSKPEILVYNKNHDGEFDLVAVEYAVPLEMSATAPEGFTGTDDVWDRNTGFNLWLLHAWVWHYNPDGVFNPTNPLVHLH
ncbi:MAG TPA: hypothetical protein VK625_16550 [Flavitalea sp.]|nr:hypothetical protein [Flavitalea sp.]